jgi:hypothetical protein
MDYLAFRGKSRIREQRGPQGIPLGLKPFHSIGFIGILRGAGLSPVTCHGELAGIESFRP